MSRSEAAAPLVLLCGGENRRMETLSGTIYKPFLDLNGASLVARHVARAVHAGQSRIRVVVDEPDPLVVATVETFGNVKGLDISVLHAAGSARVKIVNSLAALGTSGPLVIALGDSFCWFDPKAMLRPIHGGSAMGCLAVGEFREQFGVVTLREDTITSFDEKPPTAIWINLGVMAFDCEALEMLKAGWEVAELLSELSARGSLSAHRVPANFITLDSLADIARSLAGPKA